MESICGANCDKCMFNKTCNGCKKTKGCPFGKKCFIANYIDVGGKEKYNDLKKQLIDEINSLNLFKIDELYALNGSFVNMRYTLPNGNKAYFLEKDEVYLGAQIEIDDELDMCYGVVCNMNFILICLYGKNSIDAELILYKKR